MPRAITWLDLKVGIMTLSGITAVVIAVLAFARVGALHGRMTTLYTVTNEASGVIKGTPVWLAGQQAGVVREVRFRPVTADTAERLIIEMQILSRYMDRIRRNSDVQVRPGANLIGEPVVSLTVGTTAAPPVRDGDTLHARAQLTQRPSVIDLTSIGDSVLIVGSEMQHIFAQARSVTTGPIARLRQRTGTQASTVERAFNRFSERATHSRGTVSLVTHDIALRATIARVAAQSDSIRTLLADGRTNLGRFRRDSTILTAAQQIHTDVEWLRSQLAQSADSLGRTNRALHHQLDRVQLQVDSLATAIRQHPLRYLVP